MLFRAPGINKLDKRTTAIRIDETLSEKSLEGFNLAVTDMTTNLDSELALFKTRIKEDNVAQIEHREGYSGGTINIYLLIFLGLMILKKLIKVK